MNDSLPTVLRDLAATLETELMMDPAATAEISPLAVPVGRCPTGSTPSVAVPAGRCPAGSTPPTGSTPSAGLAAIAAEIAACSACPLAPTRTHTVPGVGKLSPDVLFIGEGPGADEDAQGLPFVGRAGALLTKMIAAMGYTREEVFIANIVKCRPPDNRKPTPQEMAACIPFLERQVDLVRPACIVALGATAAQGLLRTPAGINALRGHWAEYRGIPVMPTYHPAYLLRAPSAKREAWADLKLVLARLGRPVP